MVSLLKTKTDQAKEANLPPKTTGEKCYEVLQFITGKVFIIAVTAVIAFGAHPKYSPDKYGPVPNYLKKFQLWAHKALLENKVYPMGKKGPFAERMAGILASTLLLSHGGNSFAPLIHTMENSKESISTFFNKRFGRPGEVEQAHERLKDEPKLSWGDTIKGRAAAWASGFVAAAGLDAIINKTFGKHKSGHYYLDAYEEWFGRQVAGITKAGKEVAKTPIVKKLSEVQQKNKLYRFGKVIALDLYLTSATLVLWSAISRMSARDRHNKKRAAEREAERELLEVPTIFPVTEVPEAPEQGQPVQPAAKSASRLAPEKNTRSAAALRKPPITSRQSAPLEKAEPTLSV